MRIGPPEPVTLFAVAAFGVAIVGIATLIVTSARAANTHLTNATTMNQGRPASDPPRANAAALPKTDTFDADASRQIFAQLNEYYAANVIQGNTIFWASLLSMIVGFAFITFGLANAGASSTTAIVAGVAGVFSQFIAATFLVALRSTQAQSTTYAQTLVQLRMHDIRTSADARAIALGLTLLNDLAADGADTLANHTRAAIALGLITKSGSEVFPTAQAAAGGAHQNDGPRAGPAVQTRAESITFDTAGPTDSPRIPDRR